MKISHDRAEQRDTSLYECLLPESRTPTSLKLDNIKFRINTLQSFGRLLRCLRQRLIGFVPLEASTSMIPNAQTTPVSVFTLEPGSFLIKTGDKVTIIRFMA